MLPLGVLGTGLTFVLMVMLSRRTGAGGSLRDVVHVIERPSRHPHQELVGLVGRWTRRRLCV